MAVEFKELRGEMRRALRFQRENYSPDLVSEMLPLWLEHYCEIAVYQDIPLDPDLSVYINADKQGALRIFTARAGSRLEGYQVFFVHRHPHYRGSIQAVQDILFLAEGARRGINGLRFIAWCDEQLRDEGIQVVWQRVKEKHNHGPVLERLGYQRHDVTYSRRLDKWQGQQQS